MQDRRTALLLGVLVAGCGPGLPRAPSRLTQDPTFAAQALPPPPGMDDTPPTAFVLLPGDEVHWRTTGTEAADGTVVVDATGALHIPSAGNVVVGGQTLTQAEELVGATLHRMDHFANVTLAVSAPSGHRAIVLGPVVHPGVIALRPGMRLAELLATAGGLSPPVAEGTGDATEPDWADLDGARLIRGGVALPVSVARALEGDPRHNVFVRPDDVLLVPPARGGRISVLGVVRAARAMRYRRGMRLTEALAMAGGTTDRSEEGDVRVVRGPLSAPRVYTASLTAIVNGQLPDVELAPGDVIYVTAHWFNAGVGDVIQRLLPLVSAAALTIGVAGAVR